jgi:putative RecB family exonuclease
MQKPRKPILSPTKIATYLECAVKYRYIYIERIGRFYLRAKPHYSFGSTLHRVIQSFHEEGATQTAEEMAARYEQGWIAAGYESPEQEQSFRAEGAEMVQAYHAAAQERLEQQLQTLFVEKTIRTDMGPFVLAGRVDRVDRHPDGTLEIVDYKSGRWDVTPEDVASDLAMNIYQLILRRCYPNTRVIATIYCLRSGQQASAEMSDEEAEGFAEDIRALGEEILNRDYDNIEPVHIPACMWCEFLPRCERFWRRQAHPERAEHTEG